MPLPYLNPGLNRDPICAPPPPNPGINQIPHLHPPPCNRPTAESILKSSAASKWIKVLPTPELPRRMSEPGRRMSVPGRVQVHIKRGKGGGACLSRVVRWFRWLNLQSWACLPAPPLLGLQALARPQWTPIILPSLAHPCTSVPVPAGLGKALMDTIIVPRDLRQLNGKLPPPSYDNQAVSKLPPLGGGAPLSRSNSNGLSRSVCCALLWASHQVLHLWLNCYILPFL